MDKSMTFPWAVGLVGAVIGMTVLVGVLQPTPTTPPPPLDAGAIDVPFLSRPTSEPIRMRHCRDVLIEGRTFADLGPDVEAIHLDRCDGVTIRANDFARVAQAITIVDSKNVTIEWNRYLDIVGPHERVGRSRANFVQLINVTGGSIAHNKGRGGDTEDIVSLFGSGGTEADPFVIEQNHFEGTTWSSDSGSGIALGDGGSSNVVARDNVLLNAGQAGIFIAGGTNNRIIDNTVYGERRDASNVGIYVWDQSDTPCSGHEVRGNRVLWYRADGEENASWDAKDCGRVKGWVDNDWSAPLDPTLLHVTL